MKSLFHNVDEVTAAGRSIASIPEPIERKWRGGPMVDACALFFQVRNAPRPVVAIAPTTAKTSSLRGG
jgi:hypothetical protein